MARLAVHASRAAAEKKKSVGTFDATFDMPLTFDLNVGFTDAFVLNLSTELSIFASARSDKEDFFFVALLYKDLWPYVLNVRSEYGRNAPGLHVCLSEYTF